MSIFNVEDEDGLVKRFEVGEHNDNKLPLVYTKTKTYLNPLSKKPSVSMTVKVEKDGKLLDILDVDLNEVFN